MSLNRHFSFRQFMCHAVLLCIFALPQHARANDIDVLPGEIASSDEPLPVVVFLNQDELLTGRDPAEDRVYGYGILGALIGAAFDSLVEGGAENAMSQSRVIFARDEAESLLMEAIGKSVIGLNWVEMATGPPLRDNSLEAKRDLFHQFDAKHILAVNCSHNVSMRFQAVYAACWLEVMSRADLTGEAELDQRSFVRGLVYQGFVEAEVAIANPAKSVGGRREQLTANSGALLRSALTHALQNVGLLVGQQIKLSREDIDSIKSNTEYKFFTAYVGMPTKHRGYIVSGEENILCKYSPNTGGESYLYHPGRDGMVVYERSGSLYYHWTIEDESGPPTKPCRNQR